MTLPAHNPIDLNWFPRGTPLDYLGTQSRMCTGCGKTTQQECFRVIVGSTIGFGAPFFVKPFLKKSSTAGKMGGTKGEISQCTICDSLWALNNDGKAVFVALGLDSQGVLNPSFAFEAKNQEAIREEASTFPPPSLENESKVKKTRD